MRDRRAEYCNNQNSCSGKSEKNNNNKNTHIIFIRNHVCGLRSLYI